MFDRKFSGAFLTYAFAFAVAGGSPFLLLPVLTRSLSAAEFGVAAFFLMLCQLLASVSSFGTHGFISVQYFKKSPNSWGSNVSASMIIVWFTHFCLLAAVFQFEPSLNEFWKLPAGTLYLVVFSSALLCTNYLYLSIFQSRQQPNYYLLLRLVQVCLEIGLCVSLVVIISNPDEKIRTMTFPIAVGAAGLVGLLSCIRTGVFASKDLWRSIRRALSFGVPMLPHLAAGMIVSFLDRLTIASILGQSSLGIYMAATQLGLAMLLVIEPFNKAYAPWLFSRLSSGKWSDRIDVVRFTYVFFVGLAIAGVVVTIVSKQFYDLLVGEEFLEGVILIPFIVAGFVGQGMYYAMVNYIFYAEKTYILSFVSLLMAILGAAFTYVMVSKFALIGAAIAMCVNNFVFFFLVWYFAAREVEMPWLRALGIKHD